MMVRVWVLIFDDCEEFVVEIVLGSGAFCRSYLEIKLNYFLSNMICFWRNCTLFRFIKMLSSRKFIAIGFKGSGRSYLVE